MASPTAVSGSVTLSAGACVSNPNPKRERGDAIVPTGVGPGPVACTPGSDDVVLNTFGVAAENVTHQPSVARALPFATRSVAPYYDAFREVGFR